MLGAMQPIYLHLHVLMIAVLALILQSHSIHYVHCAVCIRGIFVFLFGCTHNTDVNARVCITVHGTRDNSIEMINYWLGWIWLYCMWLFHVAERCPPQQITPVKLSIGGCCVCGCQTRVIFTTNYSSRVNSNLSRCCCKFKMVWIDKQHPARVDGIFPITIHSIFRMVYMTNVILRVCSQTVYRIF